MFSLNIKPQDIKAEYFTDKQYTLLWKITLTINIYHICEIQQKKSLNAGRLCKTHGGTKPLKMLRERCWLSFKKVNTGLSWDTNYNLEVRRVKCPNLVTWPAETFSSVSLATAARVFQVSSLFISPEITQHNIQDLKSSDLQIHKKRSSSSNCCYSCDSHLLLHRNGSWGSWVV